MIYFLDIFGIIVFAITGALAAQEKQMDLFGGIVLAFVTAVGGGTFRDLVMGMPRVFWVDDPVYIIVAASSALLTFVVIRYRSFPRRTLLVSDAFGLALFTVVGTQKALSQDISPVVAVVLGVMTGVGGGMIRDVLAGQIPLILRREIYATASFCGAFIFVVLSHFLTVDERTSMTLSITVALLLRIAAIRRKWALPVYPQTRKKQVESD